MHARGRSDVSRWHILHKARKSYLRADHSCFRLATFHITLKYTLGVLTNYWSFYKKRRRKGKDRGESKRFGAAGNVGGPRESKGFCSFGSVRLARQSECIEQISTGPSCPQINKATGRQRVANAFAGTWEWYDNRDKVVCRRWRSK